MTTIQNRRGTSAQWTAKNTVLGQGEIGFETDTGKFKIGDGTTSWTALSYATSSFKSFTAQKRTSGDLTLNSTTWANVDTGTDLVVSAVVGDVIDLSMAVRASVASGSIYCVLDFQTIVSGSAVTSVTSGNAPGTSAAVSYSGWASGTVGVVGTYTYFTGRKTYTVQSGDLSSGTVTFRLRGVSGGAVTLYASDPMLYVQATNLGQPGPGAVSNGIIRDRRWVKAPASVTVDEFNDSSLDPAWTRVDGTGAVAANVTWTEDADVLSVKNAGADTLNCAHALMRPIGTAMAVGDAFVTYVSILPSAFGTNYAMAGLMLADGTTFGSGNQVSANIRMDGNSPVYLITDYRQFTGYNANPTGVVGSPAANGTHLRLVMTAANTWRVDFSSDSVSWFTGATNTFTFTPTYVGLWSSSWGSTTKHIATFEFVRRVSGVS